jgi:hypothetical protein
VSVERFADKRRGRRLAGVTILHDVPAAPSSASSACSTALANLAHWLIGQAEVSGPGIRGDTYVVVTSLAPLRCRAFTAGMLSATPQGMPSRNLGRLVARAALARGRWCVADSCKSLPLSLLVGLAVLGCGRSTVNQSGSVDSAAPADVGADLPSPDSMLLGGPDSADLDHDGALASFDLGLELASWREVEAELRGGDAATDLGDLELDASDTSIDSASSGIAGIACNGLASAYSAFLAAHRDCSSVSDCKTVGGAGTCNCVATLGNGSGEAISATAVSDAYAYFARMQVCIQQGFKFPAICDAAPAKNLRCEAGKCAANESSCLLVRG